MGIKPREIVYNIFLVKRFRVIIALLVRVSIPILAAIIILYFIIVRYASALKLNTEILFYPLSFIFGAAVLFTPFLFYVLIKEKRWAWIITFLVMVAFPSLLVFAISFGKIFSIRWMIALMVPFCLYSYLLKHTVGEWIEEYDAHKGREEQKRESARLKKQEDMW
jgi:VIT1/CCC1 family predicted Fe2+/Mn2+ transporter